MHPKLTWEEVEDKVKEFSDQYIFPTIVEKEINDEQMVYWVQTKLAKHRYDDFDNYSDDENEELGEDDDDDDTNIKDESQQTNPENRKRGTDVLCTTEDADKEKHDNFKCKDTITDHIENKNAASSS